DALALFRRLFKPYLSVNQSEQGVVSAYSYVAAWLDDRAALTHQDRASPNDRAFAAFDAEPLALAVTTVARATDALLMCHVLCLVPPVSQASVCCLSHASVRSGWSCRSVGAVPAVAVRPQYVRFGLVRVAGPLRPSTAARQSRQAPARPRQPVMAPWRSSARRAGCR